jgi:hypothetical protein
MNESSSAADTGLPDHLYDLTLLLQQAAEDARRYDAFARDARVAGDVELADWCEELASTDREVVTRAAHMLHERLSTLVAHGRPPS